jgi:DUF971 family protein
MSNESWASVAQKARIRGRVRWFCNAAFRALRTYTDFHRANAVRLAFDNVHSTGIFSWDYFLKHGRHQERLWRTYFDELPAKG